MAERSETYPNVGLVLSQRMLENTAACLASAKASLRSNVDTLRKDISDCFSHQLTLIRAREQEVLRQLEYEAEKREAQFSTQQQGVHKLIGACQMAMDSISKGESSSNFEGLINRIPHSDNKSSINGVLRFDRDSLKLRSVIGSFGAIKFETDRSKTNTNTGGSLPVEMEEYDDHIAMANHHKSVMRFREQLSRPATPVGPNEFVERWLSKVPTEADVNAMMAEFEEIKTAPAREDSSDSASFEVISQTSSKKPTALSEEFVEMLHRPLADWLLNVIPMPEKTQQIDTKQDAKSMKRRHSYDTPVQAKKYGFQNVMQEIRDSSYKDWYNPTKDIEPSPSTEESFLSDLPVPEATSLPGFNESAFNEAKFLQSLRKVFSGNKAGEESSKMRPSLTVDSVMYWKNILDGFNETQKWLSK